MAKSQTHYDVFLSHNSRDKPVVEPLAVELREQGLLYIKSSMTGNESECLKKYRDEHPSFPHEPTSDQLFDEAQFEAYRALGDHVGANLFRPELVDPIQPDKPKLPPTEDEPRPPTVREWFQGLANSLLE